MSWQRIELNMIPDTKVLPVVHASQFDSNRSISFQMFTGEDEWTIPEGLTIELHCRKVDDNIVTLAPLSVDGSVITFITTEQLTACSGQNKCELSFIDADDLVIGSLNFILDVEPDPLKGGLTSASSIYDLTQQIEDIAQEVIGDDYYNKTEVDTLLADKADVSDLPDMSQYYTKTATDTLINAKADKSDTYTKAQVDTALAAKANSADLATVATSGDYDDLINKPVLPDMTQYYTKSEVDTLLDNQFPTFTVSGDIATFTTALNKPLVSITADVSATTITRCGKNFVALNVSPYQTAVNTGVSVNNESTDLLSITSSSIAYACRQLYYKLPAGTYTVSLGEITKTGTDDPVISIYDYPNGTLIVNALSANNNVVFTLSEETVLDIRLFATGNTAEVNTVTFSDFQIELGSTPSEYEVFNGQTVPVADATTIETLSGVNNVFADTGSITVQYKYMSM